MSSPPGLAHVVWVRDLGTLSKQVVMQVQACWVIWPCCGGFEAAWKETWKWTMGNVIITFFRQVFCPPSTQSSVLYSYHSEAEEDGRQLQLEFGCWFGVYKTLTDFEQEGNLLRKGSPSTDEVLIKMVAFKQHWPLNSLSLFDIMLVEFNLLKKIFSTVIWSLHFIHSFIDVPGTPLNSEQNSSAFMKLKV